MPEEPRDGLGLGASLSRTSGSDVEAVLARLEERAGRWRAGLGPSHSELQLDPYAELGLFGVLLRGSIDGIVVNARESQWIIEVSASFEAMTGYRRSELIGRTSVELDLVDADEIRDYVTGQAASGAEGMYELRLRTKQGQHRVVQFSQQLLRSEFVVTILRDVTVPRRLELELRKLTDTDLLTGVVNRWRFKEEVEAHIREARRDGESLALVLVDLDDFRTVNDECGQSTGDNVLQLVARALQAGVQDTDLVGRLAGDEFVILLTRTGADRVQQVRAELSRSVGAALASAPLMKPPGVSIGIAICSGQDVTYEGLLRAADRDMYRQKSTKTDFG